MYLSGIRRVVLCAERVKIGERIVKMMMIIRMTNKDDYKDDGEVKTCGTTVTDQESGRRIYV